MAVVRTAVLTLIALSSCPRETVQAPARTALSPVLERASRAPRGPVETEMRHVLYHVDDRVVVQIDYLRGALLPTGDAPPWLDDPESFTLAIDTGTVTMSPASLSALLNGYVFNYEGTPLKHLEVTIERGELKQTGTLHKVVDLPFTIRASLGVTPDGRLRLHPTSVKVAGIGATGLMRTFGVELEKLVKVQRGRGVEIANNDFLLAPTKLLPPPRIDGRVKSVRLGPDRIIQTYGGSTRSGRSERMIPSDPSARNFMFYRGRVLRFGKLTMTDADLQIVDGDPSDPFDVYLAHLNEQLVAGESRIQSDYGLLTVMPDHSDLHRRAAAGATPR